MQHYFNQKDIQINTEKGSVVALGKFDGFHQGHKLLLDEVLRLQKDGYTGVVFTFDIRKNSIFDVDKLQSIITSEEKCMLAEQMGIDVLVEYPFDDAFASMEPEAFVTDILVKRLHAGYVVVGTDYGFGKKKRGNVELLRKMAGEYGYQVIVIEKKKIHDVRNLPWQTLFSVRSCSAWQRAWQDDSGSDGKSASKAWENLSGDGCLCIKDTSGGRQGLLWDYEYRRQSDGEYRSQGNDRDAYL